MIDHCHYWPNGMVSFSPWNNQNVICFVGFWTICILYKFLPWEYVYFSSIKLGLNFLVCWFFLVSSFVCDGSVLVGSMGTLFGVCCAKQKLWLACVVDMQNFESMNASWWRLLWMPLLVQEATEWLKLLPDEKLWSTLRKEVWPRADLYLKTDVWVGGWGDLWVCLHVGLSVCTRTPFISLLLTWQQRVLGNGTFSYFFLLLLPKVGRVSP